MKSLKPAFVHADIEGNCSDIAYGQGLVMS